jgi:hypothetical protein
VCAHAPPSSAAGAAVCRRHMCDIHDGVQQPTAWHMCDCSAPTGDVYMSGVPQHSLTLQQVSTDSTLLLESSSSL